jgi:hypothetical protein
VPVSGWAQLDDGDHTVWLYDAGTRAPVRCVNPGPGSMKVGSADGRLARPRGVCFTPDGAHVVVADTGNDRVSVFKVATGKWVLHVASERVHDLRCVACAAVCLTLCARAMGGQYAYALLRVSGRQRHVGAGVAPPWRACEHLCPY